MNENIDSQHGVVTHRVYPFNSVTVSDDKKEVTLVLSVEGTPDKSGNYSYPSNLLYVFGHTEAQDAIAYDSPMNSYVGFLGRFLYILFGSSLVWHVDLVANQKTIISDNGSVDRRSYVNLASSKMVDSISVDTFTYALNMNHGDTFVIESSMGGQKIFAGSFSQLTGIRAYCGLKGAPEHYAVDITISPDKDLGWSKLIMTIVVRDSDVFKSIFQSFDKDELLPRRPATYSFSPGLYFVKSIGDITDVIVREKLSLDTKDYYMSVVLKDVQDNGLSCIRINNNGQRGVFPIKYKDISNMYSFLAKTIGEIDANE